MTFGCGGSAEGDRGGVPSVGGQAIPPVVVEWIGARERVVDTLRLVAAARDQTRSDPDPPNEWVDDERQAHLLGAAQARLWLQTVFEPRHTARDIPSDAPELVKARSDPRKVRPATIHELCSLILVPPDETISADDPAWRVQGQAALARLRRHIDPLVVSGDPDACAILRDLSRYTRQTPGAEVRFEAAGFDLKACAERADDGSCARPSWAPEWVEPVQAAKEPGFLPPFFSRFGLHYVYVHAILPPRPADDPQTDVALRAEVLTQWRQRRLSEHLLGLRTQDTVRIRGESPAKEADPGP